MYVEYHHRSEILHRTLQELPEIQIEVRSLATGPNTPLRVVCAVTGASCGEFDELAPADPSISELKLLEDSEFRRLYWLRTVPDTVDQRAYEFAIDAGGVYLQSRKTNQGWYTTMNYPDQESFQTFQRRISEAGMNIEPTVIRSGQYLLSGGAFSLTDKQEAVLSEAVAGGYFEIPRETTLGEIATELSISKQAASERLRRALGAVAEAAVGSPLSE